MITLTSGDKEAQSRITSLLNALDETVLTEKKSAINEFSLYYFSDPVELSATDAEVLFIGAASPHVTKVTGVAQPAAPNSPSSSSTSTATTIASSSRGLFGACGDLSWKTFKLKGSSVLALGLLSRMLNPRDNPKHADNLSKVVSTLDKSCFKLLRLTSHQTFDRSDAVCVDTIAHFRAAHWSFCVQLAVKFLVDSLAKLRPDAIKLDAAGRVLDEDAQQQQQQTTPRHRSFLSSIFGRATSDPAPRPSLPALQVRGLIFFHLSSHMAVIFVSHR